MIDKMVENPSHYNQGSKVGYHPECITLLEEMTKGYSGIAAFCIGQWKYGYRAGAKSEEGMTQKEKLIQDFKKIRWYMNHYKEVGSFGDGFEFNKILKQEFICYKMPNEIAKEFIVSEFTTNKPEEIKPYLADAIRLSYCIKSYEDLSKIIEDIDTIINIIELKE